ncbi:MAG TPA: hypothetical protein PKY82_29150 [Pyrinomonadaceae bacterium]|nr:hypothetical protein [Pyrinomonadaceae bacterium]
MRFTPENITSLESNEIFVFGSNLARRHGKGAARTALKFGAKLGNGIGFQGKTYGIPTKDRNLRVLPLDQISIHIRNFLEYAAAHPDLIFLVTKIGCGLAGYSPIVIAPFLSESLQMKNVVLPKSFFEIIVNGQL